MTSSCMTINELAASGLSVVFVIYLHFGWKTVFEETLYISHTDRKIGSTVFHHDLNSVLLYLSFGYSVFLMLPNWDSQPSF